MLKILGRLAQLSYPLMSAAVLALAAYVVLSDGVIALDIVALLLMAAAMIAVWALLVSKQTAAISSGGSLEDLIVQSGKPTIVEVYSRYCALCLTMKPVVDNLEQEAIDQLQVIRADIDGQPGQLLKEKYNIKFTPTFLHFSASGKLIKESVGVLDRARVLHELDNL
nr:thioredoxin family protein [Anaerolineae bacterium]